VEEGYGKEEEGERGEKSKGEGVMEGDGKWVEEREKG
jgi:hypothetical protein